MTNARKLELAKETLNRKLETLDQAYLSDLYGTTSTVHFDEALSDLIKWLLIVGVGGDAIEATFACTQRASVVRAFLISELETVFNEGAEV